MVSCVVSLSCFYFFLGELGLCFAPSMYRDFNLRPGPVVR